jgi:hypothetical protein
VCVYRGRGLAADWIFYLARVLVGSPRILSLALISLQLCPFLSCFILSFSCPWVALGVGGFGFWYSFWERVGLRALIKADLCTVKGGNLSLACGFSLWWACHLRVACSACWGRGLGWVRQLESIEAGKGACPYSFPCLSLYAIACH